MIKVEVLNYVSSTVTLKRFIEVYKNLNHNNEETSVLSKLTSLADMAGLKESSKETILIDPSIGLSVNSGYFYDYNLGEYFKISIRKEV